MKTKLITVIIPLIIFTAVGIVFYQHFSHTDSEVYALSKTPTNTEEEIQPPSFQYPEFYRGIYLAYNPAMDSTQLDTWIEIAKKSHVNAFVIDVQPTRNGKNPIPKEHIQRIIDNGILPIARIVCFELGLNFWPVPESTLEALWVLAESSAADGFKEIQFDYIRFEDSNAVRHLGYQERYNFVTKILTNAREHLDKYNVRITIDVFGRIPMVQDDIIGQKMEILDELVDVILPMAYPSHYTWEQRLMDDPYYTVHWTSTSAKKRAKNAKIVSWIQAFYMNIPQNMSYHKYIEEQIRACHDAEISGYIMWNITQYYETPMKVMQDFYSTRDLITGKEKTVASAD